MVLSKCVFYELRASKFLCWMLMRIFGKDVRLRFCRHAKALGGPSELE